MNDDESGTIGARLRELRRWRRMTLTEVAGLAGISAAYLSMAERGLRSLDRRSTISALAAALRVSETDLTGGPHLGTDPLQSGPHATIPALRVALAMNAVGEPAASQGLPLAALIAGLDQLRPAYAAGDYMRIGGALPCLIDELYLHVSQPVGEAARVTSAGALAEACRWSAAMCHNLRYPDLSQLAARTAVDVARMTGDPVRVAMARHERSAPRPGRGSGRWRWPSALRQSCSPTPVTSSGSKCLACSRCGARCRPPHCRTARWQSTGLARPRNWPAG